MDTEDSVLKGTELITNTKKQRLKIQSRGQTQKYKTKSITKIIKNMYMKFALKIGAFFQIIVGYKNEN